MSTEPITVVVFNGPPGSGKDEAADYAVNSRGARHLRLKEPLVKAVKLQYGIGDADWRAMYVRELKDQPSIQLDGLSPREALIHMSENVLKPALGQDVFGRAVADKLRPGLTCLSDGGFRAELDAIADVADRLVVVHLSRDGCTFEGDSRSYVHGFETVDIANLGDDSFYDLVDETIDSLDLVSAEGREEEAAFGSIRCWLRGWRDWMGQLGCWSGS